MIPAFSLISYIVFAVCVFLIEDMLLLSVTAVFLLLLMLILPYKKLRSGLIPITLFLLITYLSNVMFNTGKIVLQVGPLIITKEGLSLAAIRTLRVFLLIAGAKFLTIVATLEEIISVLARILSPLERAGIPVKNFFNTMGLTIKVLPLVKNRISREYQTRTQTMKKKGVKELAGVVFQFLLPIFFESIRNPESILAQGNEASIRSDKKD